MNIPRHIAVIMDGNGRWAEKQGLPRSFGHKRGAERVDEIIRKASQLGVRALTLFAFSTENWSRPRAEIEMLFRLLGDMLRKKRRLLEEKNIRIRFIGRRDRFSPAVLKVIREAEEMPADKESFLVFIALDYGGRDDILRAARAWGREVVSGSRVPEDLDEKTFAAYLDLADVPEPDLLIRTSGEQRISNFLLWQLAYSEFYFTSCLWPDFDSEQLDRAISEYTGRQRRFGAISKNPEKADKERG